MGRHAYSFMEQKMIEELLSSNDEDRRYLFEEAAGIMRYNQSRRTTENKLQSVKNDLIRLEDIIAEVKHQVGLLRHQVGKAKKYQTLKQKANKIQIGLAGIKFFNQQKELLPLQTEFLKIEKKLTEIVKSLSKSTQMLNQKNNELLSVEKKLREEQNQLKEVENKINNYEKEILLNRQQISNSKSILTENLKRIKNMELHDATAHENLAKDIKTLEQSKAKLSQRITYAQELENKLNIIERKITDSHTAFEELEQKINDLSSKKQTLLKEKEENQTKQNFLSEQKQILRNKITAYQNKFEEVSKLKERNQKSGNKHYGELNNLLDQKSLLDANIQKLIDSEVEIMEKIQSRCIGIKSLKNEEQQLILWEKNLVGYETGTKKLIENFSRTKNISTLGNQIEVDDKYIALIEKSLKSLISSAVCPKAEVEEVLALLQKERLNSSILTANRHNNDFKPENNIAGAIPLREVIEIYNKDINPKIFQNIYLVSNRKIAQKLANENSNSPAELQFITKDGEVFTSFGIVKTNWQRTTVNGLLSRKKAIKNIQKEIQKETIYVSEMKKQIQIIFSEKTQKSSQLSSLLERIKDLETVTEKERGEQLQLSIQLDNLQNLLNESNSNLIHIQKEIDNIENHQREINSQLANLPQTHNESLITKQQKMSEELSLVRKNKNEMATKLNDTKIDIAKLEKDVYFFSENIKRNQRIENENRNLVLKLKESINPQEEEIASLKKITDDLENKFRSEIEVLNKYKAKVIKTENKFHTLRTEINRLKLAAHEFEFKKDIFTEDKNNIELKIQEIKLKLEHIREESFSHFHHDLTHDDPGDYADLNLDELSSELNRCQNKLNNLGPINLAAIGDYETQRKRLKFLMGQQGDLKESQNNLQQAIKELNTTAERMFLQTFHQIQQNFDKIFKEVFNGGKGELRLANETEPLKSKIGIFASPKGKKISNISLLSTGEKALTAIALLFSIYLVKPSPFCILDEIDAPLDDANVTRFLKLLNKFSEDTQFIIITHNKRTVEAVDYLYGITMEENGVSKIVSVSFS
jgi:chromosome segregation protein